MKTFLVQGVPPSLAQDGWWLSDPAPASGPPPLRRDDSAGQVKLGLLLVLIALGDVLVWQVVPGLSLAVFGAAVVVLALCAARRALTARQIALTFGMTLLVLMPLVELVQPLSIVVAVSGLSVILAMIAGVRVPQVLRGALLLWPFGVEQCFRDGIGVFAGSQTAQPMARLKRVVMAWLMPITLGAIFVLLLVEGNPVLLTWVEQLLEVKAPSLARIAFWLCLIPFAWTVLSLATLGQRLRMAEAAQARPRPFGPARQGLVNAGSVTRALMLFNAMFAVQTGLDVAFLYGGVGLPEGVTYASYAHQGAYPLLATALLAGGFALITRRWTMIKRNLRLLLILWVAQNVALVVSSLVRLDLYVDVYGLTRLRMAAAIWMGVVALGLVLIIWQVWRNHANTWLMTRGGVLGFGVLYACCFVSFDATIARHNLDMQHLRDPHYLCLLGDAAKPIIEAHERQNGRVLCAYNNRNVTQPKDWREWGFRNARTRHSLMPLRAEDRL